ncbi:MAG: MoaD/ThiS family protein [Thermoplasmata archaeon]|nr:MAG: MoaD/ThiS family protein [Thermoplasmata archaeon]UCG64752.1 MAG: MoaD/ThiS family protein [Deltaproteobacteria bacterium]
MSRGRFFNKNYLEIEMIPGSIFGFEEQSAENPYHCLRLCIPEESGSYTLRDVLSELVAGDEQLENLILDRKSGRLKGNALIILNEVHSDLLDGLDTKVKVGDRLVLLYTLAGG